jgi:hypothetical protein
VSVARSAGLVLGAALVAGTARGGGELPPWTDAADVPIPTWATSVAPRRDDVPIVQGPSPDRRRGTVDRTTRLPLYGARRGPGCGGRWLLVGPRAWVCSDVADPSPEPPIAMPHAPLPDGLPYRYFFVGKGGASGFLDARHVEDDTPDFDLDPGFGIAVTGDVVVAGRRLLRTRRGGLVPASEVLAARPSTFRGERVGAMLDFSWVLPTRANVWSSLGAGRKAVAQKARYERVPVREERATPQGVFVRISDDGAEPPLWMSAKDLARPSLSAPPPEVRPGERWIDVDLASQTLVAYEGTKPVYATLVSTGKGAQGTDTATPRGVHRIWVKLLSSDMDNLDVPDDAAGADDKRYSLEDVPYVQFFDRAVGLHGAFWHDGFGRPRSHGCVNLAPEDARWLFAFTEPKLPAGWSAVLPTPVEPGTAVRVR